MLGSIEFETALIIATAAAIPATLLTLPHGIAWMETDPRKIKNTAGTFMTGCMILIISLTLVAVGAANHHRAPDNTKVNTAPAETPPKPPQNDANTKKSPEALIYLLFSAPILVIILAYTTSRNTKKVGQRSSGTPGLAATGDLGTAISFVAAIALTALITYLITNGT